MINLCLIGLKRPYGNLKFSGERNYLAKHTIKLQMNALSVYIGTIQDPVDTKIFSKMKNFVQLKKNTNFKFSSKCWMGQ